MNRTTTRVLTAALMLMAAWQSAMAASFVALDGVSLVTDISADGSVVVGRTGSQAIRWTSATGAVGLGDLPGGTSSSLARAVSADGSVVVGYGTTASGFEAFRWTAGTGMVGLGDLGNGSFESEAYGVSADGSVVVGGSYLHPNYEAFRWTAAGGMVGLGTVPGDSISNATAVSADGLVTVGWSYSSGAMRWTSTTGMVALGLLPGGSFTEAWAVSADGSAIVGLGESSNSIYGEAFRWTADGGMVGLGDLPGGMFQSNAYGISADGRVVVGGGTTAAGSEAYIWNPTVGMRNLQDVLTDDFGIDLTGWRLSGASGISADGLTIVGSGINPSGSAQTWIATIPEPSTFVLAAFGAAALAVFGVRRRGR